MLPSLTKWLVGAILAFEHVRIVRPELRRRDDAVLDLAVEADREADRAEFSARPLAFDHQLVMRGKLALVIADGRTLVDGKEIYVAENLRVGLFGSTEAF